MFVCTKLFPILSLALTQRPGNKILSCKIDYWGLVYAPLKESPCSLHKSVPLYNFVTNLSFWRQTSANIGKIGWSVFLWPARGFLFFTWSQNCGNQEKNIFWCRGKFAVTDPLLISHSSAPFASYRTLLLLGRSIAWRNQNRYVTWENHSSSPVVVKVWTVHHCSCSVIVIRQRMLLLNYACLELENVFIFFKNFSSRIMIHNKYPISHEAPNGSFIQAPCWCCRVLWVTGGPTDLMFVQLSATNHRTGSYQKAWLVMNSFCNAVKLCYHIVMQS